MTVEQVLRALTGSVTGIARAVAFYALVSVYFAALLGFVIGANAGYAADSVDEAGISAQQREAATLSEIGDPDRISMTGSAVAAGAEVLGRDIEPPARDPRVQEAVVTFANVLLDIAIGVADVVGVAVYQNQWVPKPVWQAVCAVGGLGPCAALLWRRLRLWRSGA